MYNRYIPDDQPFAPVEPVPPPPPPRRGSRFGGEKLTTQLGELLKGFGVEKLDTGDLLLLLVVLLLWKEEENTDLLLALGAAFLLGRDT